jgi:hypothetical protein
MQAVACDLPTPGSHVNVMEVALPLTTASKGDTRPRRAASAMSKSKSATALTPADLVDWSLLSVVLRD